MNVFNNCKKGFIQQRSHELQRLVVMAAWWVTTAYAIKCDLKKNYITCRFVVCQTQLRYFRYLKLNSNPFSMVLLLH